MLHVQHHRYPDYTMTESGLQYQDLRPGSGEQPQSGSRCEVDWDGYASGPSSVSILLKCSGKEIRASCNEALVVGCY